jgi:peptidyl-prolyl cis-trans isomerase A (cyclophilin A)
MSLHRTFAVAVFAAASLAAQDAGTPAQAPARDPGLYAIINTTMGAITLKMYEAEAPVTVRNFVYLAQGRKQWKDPKTGQMVTRPLYNGTTFHRVIPKFMIQGGDPAGTGAGNVGFTIPDEFRPNLTFAKPGVLAMANIGQPNTGGCQFFITLAATPWLNGQHTIFGQVVEGMDVVNKIVATPRDAGDKPRTPVVMNSITFERSGPAPANDVLAKPAAKK